MVPNPKPNPGTENDGFGMDTVVMAGCSLARSRFLEWMDDVVVVDVAREGDWREDYPGGRGVFFSHPWYKLADDGRKEERRNDPAPKKASPLKKKRSDDAKKWYGNPDKDQKETIRSVFGEAEERKRMAAELEEAAQARARDAATFAKEKKKYQLHLQKVMDEKDELFLEIERARTRAAVIELVDQERQRRKTEDALRKELDIQKKRTQELEDALTGVTKLQARNRSFLSRKKSIVVPIPEGPLRDLGVNGMPDFDPRSPPALLIEDASPPPAPAPRLQ